MSESATLINGSADVLVETIIRPTFSLEVRFWSRPAFKLPKQKLVEIAHPMIFSPK